MLSRGRLFKSLVIMADPFSTAGLFFNRALAAQQSAAAEQKAVVDESSDDAERNPYARSLHIGSVPPDVNQISPEDQEKTDFISDVKEDLLSKARERQRPSDGEPAYRASGGINYAVKR